MKKNILTSFVLAAVGMTAAAQTLLVNTGNLCYSYRASDCGDMVYSSGKTLTIGSKTYELGSLTNITTSTNTAATNNTVAVTYSGISAQVVVAGNIAPYITATISGAKVNIVQSSAVDSTVGEITYTLSGTSTDGQFYLTGSYKSTIELNGLTLTNTTGAPIYINNGKRIDMSVKKGTENTLRDASASTDKGALYCKGHLELKGKGTLNVYAYGTKAHGIKTGDYCELKNCTVNILAATKDGLNANQYFTMESGELNISGVGDDGIQVSYEYDDDAETIISSDEENTGAFTFTGGTLTVVASASDVKCIKADGEVIISGGSISVKTTQRESEGIQSGTTMTISGGEIIANTYDDALNSKSHMTVTGGYIYAVASGNDALDANGNMYIKGGVIIATGARSPELALDANTEGGYKLYISGGTVVAMGGIERGASLTQTCYQTNSWTANSWYALYNNGSLAVAFKTPSSGGTGMVISTAGTPSLTRGVTVSDGTSLFGGLAYEGASVSGGTSVTLSTYSGNSGGGPGGGGRW